MQDVVEFGNLKYKVEHGFSEAEVREALEEQAPSAKHAQCTKVPNGDGSFTFKFVEKAGVKG